MAKPQTHTLKETYPYARLPAATALPTGIRCKFCVCQTDLVSCYLTTCKAILERYIRWRPLLPTLRIEHAKSHLTDDRLCQIRLPERCCAQPEQAGASGCIVPTVAVRVVQQWRRMWGGWQWDELHCPWCLVWFSTRTPAKLYCTKQCQRRAYYREHERTEPKEWGE